MGFWVALWMSLETQLSIFYWSFGDLIILFPGSKNDELLGVFKHILTHKRIEAKLWEVNAFPKELIENNRIFEADIGDIGNKFPIHKLMHKIFLKWQDQ